MKTNKPVFLVEDDVVDQMTVQRAFRDLNITNRLDIAGNGLDALELLRACDDLPCVILLDINMPKMNGIEFLRELRKDAKIRCVPVVMLTTSKEEMDKIDSFRLNVAGYMIKPVDYYQFVEVIRTIHLYWTLSETL